MSSFSPVLFTETKAGRTSETAAFPCNMFLLSVAVPKNNNLRNFPPDYQSNEIVSCQNQYENNIIDRIQIIDHGFHKKHSLMSQKYFLVQ